MLPVQYEEITPRKWPILIIFCLCCLPFILAKFSGEHIRGIDWFIAGSLVLTLLIYYMGMKLKIVLDNDGFEIHNIFRKQRLNWLEIRQSKLSFEIEAHSGDIKWVFRTAEGREYSFSPSYFSRYSIQKIAEALIRKSPSALISDKIRNIAEGKFPWYIF
jgi:hypothetical protein